jgi:hypothetical protein
VALLLKKFQLRKVAKKSRKTIFQTFQKRRKSKFHLRT